MRIIILVFMLFVSVSSCTKDSKSNSSTFINNETAFNITILPFKLGYVAKEDTVKIFPFERIKVYESNPWGKALSPSWGTFLQPNDSIIVLFGGTRTAKHLKFNDDSLICDNCIPFDNIRNITNESNYKVIVESENSNSISGYFEYTFTEADYEYAKE